MTSDKWSKFRVQKKFQKKQENFPLNLKKKSLSLVPWELAHSIAIKMILLNHKDFYFIFEVSSSLLRFAGHPRQIVLIKLLIYKKMMIYINQYIQYTFIHTYIFVKGDTHILYNMHNIQYSYIDTQYSIQVQNTKIYFIITEPPFFYYQTTQTWPI